MHDYVVQECRPWGGNSPLNDTAASSGHSHGGHGGLGVRLAQSRALQLCLAFAQQPPQRCPCFFYVRAEKALQSFTSPDRTAGCLGLVRADSPQRRSGCRCLTPGTDDLRRLVSCGRRIWKRRLKRPSPPTAREGASLGYTTATSSSISFIADHLAATRCGPACVFQGDAVKAQVDELAGTTITRRGLAFSHLRAISLSRARRSRVLARHRRAPPADPATLTFHLNHQLHRVLESGRGSPGPALGGCTLPFPPSRCHSSSAR